MNQQILIKDPVNKRALEAFDLGDMHIYHYAKISHRQLKETTIIKEKDKEERRYIKTTKWK
jgi:hypothetical protein